MSTEPEPPQICANVPGTWAFDTMVHRILHDMLPRVEADNAQYLEEKPLSKHRFEVLMASLQQSPSGTNAPLHLLSSSSSSSSSTCSPLRPLDDSGEDVSTWTEILQTIPLNAMTWLDAPWIITEFYLHRRVMEAFQYFETGYDPYKVQKQNGLYACGDAVEQLASLFLTHSSARITPTAATTTATPSQSGCEADMLRDDIVELGVFTSLWGNKKDLSLFPAPSPAMSLRSKDKEHPRTTTTATTAATATSGGTVGSSISASIAHAVMDLRSNSAEFILDNQMEELLSHLHQVRQHHVTNTDTDGAKTNSVGVVVDNAGFEIISDFFLGHALLVAGVAKSIIFYTKQHPTFVSDATTQDCHEIIDYLATKSQRGSSTSVIATMWQDYVSCGKFQFQSDFFWCQPTGFKDCPAHIAKDLSSNSINFIKGDANYRRVLDDRQWDFATPSSEIFSYWRALGLSSGHVSAPVPVRVCTLRALKSEVACGVDEARRRVVEERDPRWMVGGDWALIQCNV